MPSVNLSKSLLEEITPEEGEEADELEWDKSSESFSEYFERLLRKADLKTDKILVGENALDHVEDRLEDRMRSLFREFSR